MTLLVARLAVATDKPSAGGRHACRHLADYQWLRHNGMSSGVAISGISVMMT